jgi:hypothetical protein
MAEKYWYCVKHHAVEGADGCGPIDRLGPYPSREEAERALEKVAERNEAWEAQDRAEGKDPDKINPWGGQ